MKVVVYSADRNCCQTLVLLLSNPQHEIRMAPDQQSVHVMLDNSEVDVLIIDMALETLEQFEIFRDLSRQHPSLRLIVLIHDIIKAGIAKEDVLKIGIDALVERSRALTLLPMIVESMHADHRDGAAH